MSAPRFYTAETAASLQVGDMVASHGGGYYTRTGEHPELFRAGTLFRIAEIAQDQTCVTGVRIRAETEDGRSLSWLDASHFRQPD